MQLLTSTQIETLFGPLPYRDDPHRTGAIVIAADWIARNIVHIISPFPLRDGNGAPVKQIACHHRVAPRLAAVLADLLTAKLTPFTWDGCLVPRHMLWDPKRGLSRHSWGIAVDVNARSFPYGSAKRQDPRLVEAFARHGFLNGADWSTPDPMHFEISDAILSAVKDLGSAGETPAPVEWRPDGGDSEATLHITLDGRPLPTPGRLIDGVSYLPARAIAEALDLTIHLDPDTEILYLTRKP